MSSTRLATSIQQLVSADFWISELLRPVLDATIEVGAFGNTGTLRAKIDLSKNTLEICGLDGDHTHGLKKRFIVQLKNPNGEVLYESAPSNAQGLVSIPWNKLIEAWASGARVIGIRKLHSPGEATPS